MTAQEKKKKRLKWIAKRKAAKKLRDPESMQLQIANGFNASVTGKYIKTALILKTLALVIGSFHCAK